MRAVNKWVMAQPDDNIAGIPTGYTNRRGDGTWVAGVVLFSDKAVDRQDVEGPALYPNDACTLSLNGDGLHDPQPGKPGGPVPTPRDGAPFGYPLWVSKKGADWLRCMATTGGRADFALLYPYDPPAPDGKVMAAARMEMTPRSDGRTLVFFENWNERGAWLVAHRFDPVTGSSAGEVASVYLPSAGRERFAFELTTSPNPAPGQIQADSVGFVEHKLLAKPIMSFAWSAWAALSPGMNIALRWV